MYVNVRSGQKRVSGNQPLGLVSPSIITNSLCYWNLTEED